MNEGEDLDCNVLSVMMRHLNISICYDETFKYIYLL